ncbi:MAG: stage II sporulation protein R [Clostridia bacterium]|nr:stage II sporulation protein R [Clostridia bacterium]
MKFLLTFSFSVLIATLLLNFLPVHGEEAVYEDTVRLHVIAASDSEEDQEVKLKVRDSILRCISEEMKNARDTESAVRLIDSMKGEIKRCADETLKLEGFDDEVKIEFGHEKYPVRYYSGFTLPSGTYKSLRVVIGEGEGKNWWCILFPSVCMSNAVSAKEDYVMAGFTPDQYKIIDNKSSRKYKVRFKILEILSDFTDRLK